MSDNKAARNALLASVGTVGGIGALVTGSSAATMTSGLALLGGLVGGGMAAGIVVSAATPFTIACIVYKATKYLEKRSRRDS